MKVTCDKCGEEFELKTEIERLDNGVERNYFKCTHCHKDYTVSYTNELIRKKIRRIRDIKKEWIDLSPKLTDNRKARREYDKHNKKLNKVKEETQSLMNELRKKIEGAIE